MTLIRPMRSLLAFIAFACMSCAALAQSSPFLGTWTFAFTGGDSGGGTAIVSATGQITGRGNSSVAGTAVDVSGTVTTDGRFSFKGTPRGATSLESTFVGSADKVSGHASGTWTNPGADMQGTWTASRASQTAKPSTVGMHCAGDAGTGQQGEWTAADVSALYSAKNAAVYVVVLKQTGDDDADQWELTVHALGITGPGTFDIIDKPGRRSTLNHSVGGASPTNHQSARGSLTVTRLGGGSMAGSLDMKGGALSTHCTFDILISGAP